MQALTALNQYEAATLAAVFERMFPGDVASPGATEIGAHVYVDLALAAPYRDLLPTYQRGLAALDGASHGRLRRPFTACTEKEQDALLSALERGDLSPWDGPPQEEFFSTLRAHLQEGLFSDPIHGGNHAALGWRFLGHTGIWFENSAEENLSSQPVTKDGEVRTLYDVRPFVPASDLPPIREQRRGARIDDADVVLVGVGAMGSLAAHILSRRGMRVVGLEAGPYRREEDFIPDELTSAYYCRGEMGRKFLDETPRWRRHPGEETKPAVFSLGRMMNGVGGSVIHWGGALRRCHPHHFRYLSHVRKRWGEGVLPEGHTLVDWPVQYDDLEPYYTEIERQIGVAGDAESNPFVPRREPLPLPPLRPFTGGELFRGAAERMGLHPYPTPVAVNSRPYNGGSETTYCAWMGGFGPFRDDRWYPGHTWIPESLATGNFDLRTDCRVLRLLRDENGAMSGVEYVDADGVMQVQRARTVILCSYTFENVRLMSLSGGLGNRDGQLGKHFMVKAWDDVHGFFPDTVFNAHTGPSGQMWGLDDFVAETFDSVALGFVGGVTPSVENQQLPIQISREELPPDVRRWGAPYKEHLARWQNVYAVRLQPETLSYEGNYIDLDPVYRDRSGLGLPVIRITYDLRKNEERQADWAEGKAEEILREMGAERTWRGPRSCRVCSSHDLGGCRMGEDPRTSVVDPDLQVHDTSGLYVFSGAVFPTCPGVNPTLTMWALCARAAERIGSG